MRRGSIRWPLRKRLASCAVCCTPRLSRSSAASFCWAFGPAADAFPWRDDLNPSRSRPFPPVLLPFGISLFVIVIFDLFTRCLAEGLVGGDDCLHCFSRIVCDEHQIEIALGDFPLCEHSRL